MSESNLFEGIPDDVKQEMLMLYKTYTKNELICKLRSLRGSHEETLVHSAAVAETTSSSDFLNLPNFSSTVDTKSNDTLATTINSSQSNNSHASSPNSYEENVQGSSELIADKQLVEVSSESFKPSPLLANLQQCNNLKENEEDGFETQIVPNHFTINDKVDLTSCVEETSNFSKNFSLKIKLNSIGEFTSEIMTNTAKPPIVESNIDVISDTNNIISLDNCELSPMKDNLKLLESDHHVPSVLGIGDSCLVEQITQNSLQKDSLLSNSEIKSLANFEKKEFNVKNTSAIISSKSFVGKPHVQLISKCDSENQLLVVTDEFGHCLPSNNFLYTDTKEQPVMVTNNSTHEINNCLSIKSSESDNIKISELGVCENTLISTDLNSNDQLCENTSTDLNSNDQLCENTSTDLNSNVQLLLPRSIKIGCDNILNFENGCSLKTSPKKSTSESESNKTPLTLKDVNEERQDCSLINKISQSEFVKRSKSVKCVPETLKKRNYKKLPNKGTVSSVELKALNIDIPSSSNQKIHACSTTGEKRKSTENDNFKRCENLSDETQQNAEAYSKLSKLCSLQGLNIDSIFRRKEIKDMIEKYKNNTEAIVFIGTHKCNATGKIEPVVHVHKSKEALLETLATVQKKNAATLKVCK